jgi:hypothetical protein
MSYFWPYGLTKSPRRATFKLVVVIIGALGLGLGIFGGAAGQPIRPNALRNVAVLLAAPTKCIPTVPCISAFSRLYAPPPYSNVTSVYVLFLALTPSRRTVPPLVPLSDITIPLKGGTIGTAFGNAAWAKSSGCRLVEAWFPNAIAQSTPATNDANASVDFRITPPSRGYRGDCTKWVYHYGTAPSKQSDSKPQILLVGSPEGQRLPQ